MAQNILNTFGYVVYQRESTSALWRAIRQKKEAEVKQSYNNIVALKSADNPLARYDAIGEHLISMGNAERTKELDLISERLGGPIDAKDEATFLQNFNEILVGIESFKQAVEQLRRAQDQFRSNKGTKSQLENSITSVLPGKVHKYLGQALNKTIATNKTAIASGDFSAWESSFDTLFRQSVDLAVQEVLMTMNPQGIQDIFGSDFDHSKEYQLYMNDVQKRESLYRILSTRIDMDKMKNILSDNFLNIKSRLSSKARMTGWTWIHGVMKTSKRAGQLGGAMNEWWQSMRQSLQDGLNGDVMRAEHQRIDNTIYSQDITIDLKPIMEELQKELEQSASLNESAKIYEDFFNQHLSQLKEGFVIFSSGKAYGLNKGNGPSGHAGFKNDSERKLIDTLDIFQANGQPLSLAKDLFTAVVNTMNGAVLQGKDKEIKEALRIELYSAMAQLFFDDWVMLGNETGGNVIHIFTLNEINVPLSTVLLAAGQAVKQATKMSEVSQFLSISMHIPKKIKFDSPAQYPKTSKGAPNASAAWIEQRQSAIDETNFSSHFLKNFYDLINNLLPKA